jgi:hypothetical protein
MRRVVLVAGLVLAGLATSPRVAGAQVCRLIDIEMLPSSGLQIVAWIEDTNGQYVDTAFITNGVGIHGLGNRPGLMDMRSGPSWPYGPRLDVMPVWGHAHGIAFPMIVFQNGEGTECGPDPLEENPPPCSRTICGPADSDHNLSHPFSQSSRDDHFCRPIQPDEEMWDTGSCATIAYTDKGMFLDPACPTETSIYPPRVSHVRVPGLDHLDVLEYDGLNPFDLVSQATPAGDVPFRTTWTIPQTVPAGDYILRVEVSKEFDFNASYNESVFPPLEASSWNEYGLPYHGQPSVVYELPVTVPDFDTVLVTRTDEYAGYGDPTGSDGDMRLPDATITTGTPGSGAARLGLALDSASGEMYRVQATARIELDTTAPAAAGDMTVVRLEQGSADIAFVAPGDDGLIGEVAGYEIRYRATEPIDETNFETAPPWDGSVERGPGGEIETIVLDGLLPLTTYYLAIRAYDNCRNVGPLAILELTTLDRQSGEVDACFIATAAYGSRMANDVVRLRRIRDAALRSNLLGELAVEAYYTFGPLLAGVIGESELLRDSARSALDPVVAATRTLAY